MELLGDLRERVALLDGVVLCVGTGSGVGDVCTGADGRTLALGAAPGPPPPPRLRNCGRKKSAAAAISSAANRTPTRGRLGIAARVLIVG